MAGFLQILHFGGQSLIIISNFPISAKSLFLSKNPDLEAPRRIFFLINHLLEGTIGIKNPPSGRVERFFYAGVGEEVKAPFWSEQTLCDLFRLLL